MKYCIGLITALIIIGCSKVCCAQTYEIVGYTEKDSVSTVSPVVVKPAATPYLISKPAGLRMRNVGRTLTITGTALLIGGIIVFNNAEETYYTTYQTPNGTYEDGDPQAALGMLMIVGGAGMTVPGIIFWSKGAKKYKRYLERQEASISYGVGGVSLRYKF